MLNNSGMTLVDGHTSTNTVTRCTGHNIHRYECNHDIHRYEWSHDIHRYEYSHNIHGHVHSLMPKLCQEQLLHQREHGYQFTITNSNNIPNYARTTKNENRLNTRTDLRFVPADIMSRTPPLIRYSNTNILVSDLYLIYMNENKSSRVFTYRQQSQLARVGVTVWWCVWRGALSSHRVVMLSSGDARSLTHQRRPPRLMIWPVLMLTRRLLAVD